MEEIFTVQTDDLCRRKRSTVLSTTHETSTASVALMPDEADEADETLVHLLRHQEEFMVGLRPRRAKASIKKTAKMLKISR